MVGDFDLYLLISLRSTLTNMIYSTFQECSKIQILPKRLGVCLGLRNGSTDGRNLHNRDLLIYNPNTTSLVFNKTL